MLDLCSSISVGTPDGGDSFINLSPALFRPLPHVSYNAATVIADGPGGGPGGGRGGGGGGGTITTTLHDSITPSLKIATVLSVYFTSLAFPLREENAANSQKHVLAECTSKFRGAQSFV